MHIKLMCDACRNKKDKLLVLCNNIVTKVTCMKPWEWSHNREARKWLFHDKFILFYREQTNKKRISNKIAELPAATKRSNRSLSIRKNRQTPLKLCYRPGKKLLYAETHNKYDFYPTPAPPKNNTEQNDELEGS